MHESRAPTPRWRQAVVATVDAGPPPTLTVDALGEASLRYLAGYTPTVGDTVWLIQNDSDAVAIDVLASAAATALLPVEHFQTTNDTTTSTTYVGGNTHGVAFVAPPSGQVYVSFSGLVGTNGVAGIATIYTLLSDHVRTGSTIGSGTDVMAASDDRAIQHRLMSIDAGFKYFPGGMRHLVTGLTAGNDYNAVTVFRNTTGGATAAVDNRWILVEPVL